MDLSGGRIQPLSETTETVTLSREDYDRLISKIARPTPDSGERA